MTSSPSSRVAATNIPTITALRQELGYGDASSPRCDTFNDDVRAFRKKFRTRDGFPGVDLHDWKSKEHQTGLNEMTNAFLNTGDNGTLYWPDDIQPGQSPRLTDLQYSKDETRIRSLMKQLFFRLNQQQYRNNKYKHKGTLSSRESQDRGLSTKDPIEVDDLEESSTFPHSDAYFRSVEHEPPQNRRDLMKPAPSGSRASTLSKRKPKSPYPGVYDVPTSPEVTLPQSTGKDKTSAGDALPMTSTIKRRERPQAQDRQPKRLQMEKANYEDDPEFLDPALRATNTPKTSPRRERKTRRHWPEHVTGDEYSEALVEEAVAEVVERMTQPVSAGARGGALPKKRNAPITSAGSRPVATMEENSINVSAPDQLQLPTTPRETTIAAGRPDQLHSKCPEAPGVDMSHSKLVTLRMPPTTTRDKQLQSSPKHDAPSAKQEPNKPTITFTYGVILSRNPYRYKGWSPRGRFQDKSLSDLINELPLEGEITGLVFNLSGPDGMEMEDRISVGDESHFESMKRRFNKGIRSHIMSRSGGQPITELVLDLDIEPVTSTSAGVDEQPQDQDFVYF